jgi:hypothetical protein
LTTGILGAGAGGGMAIFSPWLSGDFVFFLMASMRWCMSCLFTL